MIEPPLQRRAPLPPQLTRRVGVLGVLAFVLFGIIGFRLWYLQVLTGPQNVALATANVERAIPIAAPRGEIVDRNGTVLATTRVAAEAAIIADELPPKHSPARWRLYERLARVLGMKPRDIWAIIQSKTTPGYRPAAIKNDLSTPAEIYLGEHQRSFPGVIEQQVNVREYPHGTIGGVVLGAIGQITGPPTPHPQLGSAAFKGIKSGTYVGQAGLEAQYNRYLQGRDGVERVQVNASGHQTGAAPALTPPASGDELKTSLDYGLEKEGYIALRKAMRAARQNGDPAPAGSFFAMDPMSGRVLALGSLPSYNPSLFVTPPSTAAYDPVLHSGALNNTAVDSYYPTGSTFKPVTALAALRAGYITAQTTQGGGACRKISTTTFCNSGQADFGDQNLVGALTVSEDTYFYLIGAEANGSTGNGHAIQDEARALGLGAAPGIDLPGGGSAGLVPDRAVMARQNAQILAADCVGTRPRASLRGKPGYATLVTACSQGYYYPPWTIGQNVGLATGQGYLEASPMQMAVAYSAIVNPRGTVWRPQIGMQILTPSGRVKQQLPPPAAMRHVAISPADQALVMTGLHDAAQSPTGTSYAVFGDFPRTVYGKTGTAVHAVGKDQSWYVAYAPDARRPIVIAVTIEQGGFGAAAAAPAARLMLSQWFGLPKRFLPGTSRDH